MKRFLIWFLLLCIGVAALWYFAGRPDWLGWINWRLCIGTESQFCLGDESPNDDEAPDDARRANSYERSAGLGGLQEAARLVWNWSGHSLRSCGREGLLTPT